MASYQTTLAQEGEKKGSDARRVNLVATKGGPDSRAAIHNHTCSAVNLYM